MFSKYALCCTYCSIVISVVVYDDITDECVFLGFIGQDILIASI